METNLSCKCGYINAPNSLKKRGGMCGGCGVNLILPDPVAHPPHYKGHPSGIECIEITRHMNFNLGNAVKYIWRNASKGRQIEDLKKAAWYINDEIKRLEAAK